MRRGDDVFEDAALLRLQVEPAVREDVRFDALEDAELAGEALVETIDLAVLAAGVLHADAAGDRQTVGMIGDAHARVAAREAAVRHGFDALASVAPGRVHLKVATEVALRHDGGVARQGQRLLHRHLAEEVGAQLPQRRDLVRLPRPGNCRIDRRRSARFHELRDDPRAGRADVGHLAQRARGYEVADRQRQRDDGLRRALVTELRAFIRLQGGHVVEKAGGDHVDIGRRLDVLAGSPFSPPAAGSGVCSQVHTLRRRAGRDP